ncbi:MAG TPA: polysaccharide deacetylase family protein [Burkholderiales bacterium]|jgi:peptidoglycan/xylan/chitin deacetylase (PgdA/CDA1 family)
MRVQSGSEGEVSEGTRVLQAGVESDLEAPPRARWRPSAFVRFSFVLHAVALLLLVVQPHWWPWLLGLIAANHGVIILSVPFPRSRLVGANITRLPPAAAARDEIALTFDDGPDPVVTPKVLDLLESAGMRASFFLIARNAGRHPELVREILRRGHQVENHSNEHGITFSFYGYGRTAREVDAAQAALTAIAERRPRFFRAPAGFRNPFLDPVLQRRGLRYASWTRRGFDAFERDPARVLKRLTRGLAGGDVLLLHDAGSAMSRAGNPVVLEVLPPLLEQMRSRGLQSVTLAAAFNES